MSLGGPGIVSSVKCAAIVRTLECARTPDDSLVLLFMHSSKRSSRLSCYSWRNQRLSDILLGGSDVFCLLGGSEASKVKGDSPSEEERLLDVRCQVRRALIGRLLCNQWEPGAFAGTIDSLAPKDSDIGLHNFVGL